MGLVVCIYASMMDRVPDGYLKQNCEGCDIVWTSQLDHRCLNFGSSVPVTEKQEIAPEKRVGYLRPPEEGLPKRLPKNISKNGGSRIGSRKHFKKWSLPKRLPKTFKRTKAPQTAPEKRETPRNWKTGGGGGG